MKMLPTLVLSVVLAAALSAQQVSPPTPPPAPAPAAPAQPPPPPPPPPAPPAPPEVSEPINVRYEISVRDTGGPQPGTKTVSMTATLGDVSSVRASGTAAGRPNNPLNIDAWPTALRDDKVRTRISIEYVPQSAGTMGPPPLSIRQTIHVWLNNKAPMVVSQATDPNSDRRLEVAVTATIMR